MYSTTIFQTLLFATWTSVLALPAVQCSSLISRRQAEVEDAAKRALVVRYSGDAKQTTQDPYSTAQCQLSSAKMPQAPTPLPAPASGLVLTHVVVGRGTQNYTCADSTLDSVPVANGAVATLFNATCMASTNPQILSTMPGVAVRYSVPANGAADTFMAGHHFFPDATTPEFDLNTSKHQWGIVKAKKDTAVSAPNPSKDVPWLKLAAKSAEGNTIAEVYRLDTAGGVAPANCKGQPATFEVQYAANYWMWSKP